MFRKFVAKAARPTTACVGALALLFALSTTLHGQSTSGDDKVDAMVGKAIEYLQARVLADDGSYSEVSSPGVTAIVTAGILRHGVSPDEPFVQRSLKYLEGLIKKDGGVYAKDSLYQNYETSVAILCFTEANADGRYDEVIKRASGYLQGIQWDESEDKAESDMFYGGAGYGKHGRPDLSNTAFMVEALVAAGEESDSDAIQRALLFISRSQNLESEHNTTPHPNKNPDGGFYYTPANGGESQAGETANGGLRSYASMTYAGLKSMIYAGVDADDPRVVAATDWLRKNYDLKSNPGMGAAGLFYYYHTCAKALHAVGDATFKDSDGKEHAWQQELIDELASKQQADGSWINEENPRWLEDNSALVTGYALLALSYCRSDDLSK